MLGSGALGKLREVRSEHNQYDLDIGSSKQLPLPVLDTDLFHCGNELLSGVLPLSSLVFTKLHL